jgi:glycosyltransferase involved in cell wall biosynthesis
LAEAIVNLIENPQLRQEMSFRARQRAEVRYNWGKTAENLLRAYEKNTNFKGTMRYEVKTEGLGELTLKNI